MKTKIVFLCIYVIGCSIGFAQNTFVAQGSMTILDSVVIKKHNKDAIELSVRLSFPEADSVVLSHFYEYVNSDGLYSLIKDDGVNPLGDCGLTYAIEDENGNYISTGYNQLVMVSCENVKDESDFYDKVWKVNKRSLKAKRVLPKEDEKEKLSMSKLVVCHNDTIVKLYPIILDNRNFFGSRTPYPPGKYKLFLFYSQEDEHNILEKNKRPGEHVFKGSMVSNKIDIIIK